MKKSRKIAYAMLSIASICAVVAVVFMTSVIVAHACSSGSCYGYNNYYDTPTYSYSTYQYPPSNPVVSPLTATCYISPTSAYVGQAVTWSSSVNGGTGSNNISWSGDEGLYGNGSSITKTYSTPGSKTASIRVISGSQTISVNCSDSINISSRPAPVTPTPIYNYNNYNTYPTYSYNQYPYNYNYNYNNYSPLSVSCSPSTTYAGVGSTIYWTASVSGGNGYNTYTWYGTDGLYGSGQSTAFTYNNPGTKTAYVTVYSNGQSATGYCQNSVNITSGYYGNTYGNVYNTGYIITPNPSTNTLDIGCYADPSSISVNQPVTWNVEVSGGIAPYTYTWSGSDGLTGTQTTSIKYYATVGEKNAIVTVTSADGKSGTRACSNTVTVRGAATTVVRRPVNTGTTVQPPVNQNQNGGQLSGSAIFSFDNVPWGWIAILIILVLFATVMYLLFNRQKI